LSQAFSYWYLPSWTSCDPNRTGLKFQTAVLSVLYVLLQVYPFPSEHIECATGMASKFFFKIFVTIPVAQIITGMITHFMSHIRCIIKLLYLIPCLLPFVWHSCPLVLPHYQYACFLSLSLFVLNFYTFFCCCANAAISVSSNFHIFRRQQITLRFDNIFSVTS
jgi:hypothetical protein